MNSLSLGVIIAASCMLTGCVDIEGVHVLHNWGDSNTGTYRFTMSSFVYGMLVGDGTYANRVKRLETWSRPQTRVDGDFVHLEDTSGTASMDNFYDSHGCNEAPVSGFEDCHFSYTVPADSAKLPGWTLNWTVVMQPGMEVLSSNHHRRRQENGLDYLSWYFNGNQVSAANIDFTVRMPLPRPIMIAPDSVPFHWVPPSVPKVAGVRGNLTFLNRGSAAGVKAADRFQVVRMVDSGLKDPDTGQPIMRKQQICLLTISEVDDSLSSGECKGDRAQNGDQAMATGSH